MSKTSPYPFTGGSPDLESGAFYLDDYVLAERIATDPSLDFETSDAAQSIKEAVHEAMDLDRLAVDVSVVATMAVKARQRNLRRPQEQTRREIRRVNTNFLSSDFFNLNKARALQKEQLKLIQEQVACLVMTGDYRREAVTF